MSSLSDALVARFWSKVAKSEACWLWMASCDKDGYGKFWARGKINKAHRFAFELAHGHVPKGLFVCHSCDNPACVNPAHLWAGTSLDNVLDRNTKGRANAARGGQHYKSKLTAQEVQDVRRLRLVEGVSQRVLARRFGVSDQVISGIVLWKWWKSADRGHECII